MESNYKSQDNMEKTEPQLLHTTSPKQKAIVDILKEVRFLTNKPTKKLLNKLQYIINNIHEYVK